MNYTITSSSQKEGVYRVSVAMDDNQNVSLFFRADPSQEEIEDTLADLLWEAELQADDYEDRVYHSGAMVRLDVRRAGLPSVGRGAGSRAPYLEDHESAYYMSKPSAELLDQWGVSDRKSVAHWYGIKTVDSGASYLKLVRYKASWPNEPSLPGTAWAYASVYSEDGTESDIKDVYVNARPEEMRQWCANNSLTYPLATEETKRPWCFGVYWNSVTGAVEGVKGYVRYT